MSNLATSSDSSSRLNAPSAPVSLPESEEISESATMAFEFESSSDGSPSSIPPSMRLKPVASPSPSAKPSSSSAKPAVPSKPKTPAVDEANPDDDDDMFVSKVSLDAANTYEKEDFKKSLYFDREEDRWDGAEQKYELPKKGYWQILPLTPTGYGDSPYQSASTFAGNPYLVDLDLLKQQGLLIY